MCVCVCARARSRMCGCMYVCGGWGGCEGVGVSKCLVLGWMCLACVWVCVCDGVNVGELGEL